MSTDPMVQRFSSGRRDPGRLRGRAPAFRVHPGRRGEETEWGQDRDREDRDLLTHRVRNAVDHGPGTPAARIEVGKPEAGRVPILGLTPRMEKPAAGPTVNVEHDGRLAALLVDELPGQQQVVIKSLVRWSAAFALGGEPRAAAETPGGGFASAVAPRAPGGIPARGRAVSRPVDAGGAAGRGGQRQRAGSRPGRRVRAVLSSGWTRSERREP